ncbi:MAG: efflux RND transporter permease subunit, partial [Mucinivorans sp.]
TAGTVFENERRFGLVVRLDPNKVSDLNLDKFFVRTADGVQIPVSEVTSIELVNGPLQINRDATKRRVVIGVNVRNADIQQVVGQIQQTLKENVKLDAGYYFEYGGQFENLQNAINTLLVVVPIALSLILLLLFFAFKSVTYTLVVFSTVPLSLIGGICALYLRGLPFSISAGVGFIALFGVAVLNGILMINHFNDIARRTKYGLSTDKIIAQGTPHLLRPVFLTGLVASLGFVPMAIATTAGAEVQRPLATVVIGGLIVSTILTLLIIPVFYRLVATTTLLRRNRIVRRFLPFLALFIMLGVPSNVLAQESVTMEQALNSALSSSPRLKSAGASIERAKSMYGLSWEVGPISVTYSRGQINGPDRNDSEWAIEQPLGSLMTPFYKDALVRQQVNTSKLYREMVVKEITAEAKRAWVYYLYSTELCRLYENHNQLALQLQHAAQVRYNQGEITPLERNMMATTAATMHNKLFQARQQQTVALNRLRWACFLDENSVPSDTTLFQIETETTSMEQPSQIYIDYFNSRLKETTKQLHVERSRFFPELAVGYNNQTIQPVRGLSTWSVKASLPLFALPQKSRIKQAKIDNFIAQNDAQTSLRNLSNTLTELRQSIIGYRQSLQFYNTSALKESQELIRATQLQLNSNEIDITQFVQSIGSALEIRRGYFETLYLYDVAAVEYELYNN